MMASFYGEILPVISRAVDDDDEENAPKPRELILHWNSNGPQEKVECETLIITIGEVAWRFVEIYHEVKKSEQVVEIIENRKDDDDCGFEAISKQPNVVSTVYKKHNPGKVVVFVACKSYIPPEQIWPWITKFFELVAPSDDVFVLTSSSIQEYKCEDTSVVETPLIRSLSTATKPKGHPVFPTLEQPNMMKNIPAAIISHCQFHNIPAISYICYTETMHLDSTSVQAFNKLCDTPQFNIPVDPEFVTKNLLHAVKNSNTGYGLYT